MSIIRPIDKRLIVPKRNSGFVQGTAFSSQNAGYASSWTFNQACAGDTLLIAATSENYGGAARDMDLTVDGVSATEVWSSPPYDSPVMVKMWLIASPGDGNYDLVYSIIGGNVSSVTSCVYHLSGTPSVIDNPTHLGSAQPLDTFPTITGALGTFGAAAYDVQNTGVDSHTFDVLVASGGTGTGLTDHTYVHGYSEPAESEVTVDFSSNGDSCIGAVSLG